jgi:hypothetical protein
MYVLYFWQTGFGWARWVISNEDITAVVPDSYPQNYAMPVAKILKINSALGDLGFNRMTFLLSSRGASPRTSEVYHLSNDRLWRKADIGETPTSAKYQQPDIPENRLLTPELYSRPGRLSFGRLTGATSRRSVCVHRQGELKRGAERQICGGR